MRLAPILVIAACWLPACCSGKKTEEGPPPAPTLPGQVLEGAPVPDADVTLHDGRTVKLSSFAGKQVVLYFYPKDATPGCTVEAQEFRDLHQTLEKEGIVVIGVSTQDAASHKSFAEQEKLPFALAVDTDNTLGKIFHIDTRDGLYARQTVLLSPDRKLKKVWRVVEPKGHAAEVLAAAKGPLGTGKKP